MDRPEGGKEKKFIGVKDSLSKIYTIKTGSWVEQFTRGSVGAIGLMTMKIINSTKSDFDGFQLISRVMTSLSNSITSLSNELIL